VGRLKQTFGARTAETESLKIGLKKTTDMLTNAQSYVQSCLVVDQHGEIGTTAQLNLNV